VPLGALPAATSDRLDGTRPSLVWRADGNAKLPRGSLKHNTPPYSTNATLMVRLSKGPIPDRTQDPADARLHLQPLSCGDRRRGPTPAHD